MRRRYAITGRVQGVGFRFFAQRRAGQHGIAGWVRNRPDGGVECEAQGSADQLDGFEALLREGPRGAQVTGFEVAEISDEENGGQRFEIRG